MDALTELADLAEEEQASVSLDDIRAYGEELAKLVAQAAGLEAALKAINSRITEIRTRILPDLMAAAGMTSFTLSNGTTVKLDNFISGSLPKEPERREQAIRWIVEHGGADIVRATVVQDFSVEQYGEAAALADQLRSLGWKPEVSTAVHPQTLYAWLRDRLRQGEHVDTDTLGVFIGRIVRVKRDDG
jgi:hypothetical protein